MGGELVSTRSRVWDHLSGKVRGVRAAGDVYPPTLFWVGHVSSMTSFLSFFLVLRPSPKGPSYLGVGPPLGKSEGEESCGRWFSLDAFFGLVCFGVRVVILGGGRGAFTGLGCVGRVLRL